MAFKTANQIKKERYAGKFNLQNDGDYADVIFMYTSSDDELVADAHYIKSAEYSGYVHCCGAGCPACHKGIRVQNKLFIPLCVLSINDQPVDEIQFWDRTMNFDYQLQQHVFKHYENPSEYVFRITRHGEARSIETKYTIEVIGTNKVATYNEILDKNGMKSPDYYENVIKEVAPNILQKWLDSGVQTSNGAGLPEYTPTPRVSVTESLLADNEEVPFESDIDF